MITIKVNGEAVKWIEKMHGTNTRRKSVDNYWSLVTITGSLFPNAKQNGNVRQNLCIWHKMQDL